MRALLLLLGMVTGFAWPSATDRPSQGEDTEGPTHLGRHLFTIHGVSDPRAVAFGPEGDLWVAGRRVRRFDDEGTEIPLEDHPDEWERATGISVGASIRVMSNGSRMLTGRQFRGQSETIRGNSSLLFCSGGGLATRGWTTAVADPMAGWVLLFLDPGVPIVGSEELSRPMDVAWSDENELYVIDADTSRVEVYDQQGIHLRGFGAWGAFPGLLADPHGIDVWGNHVFVADTANHRIQVYTLAGKRAYTFGLHAIVPREGKGKLHYPSAVAISRDGSRMAVAEPLDDRVQVFGRAPGAEPPEDSLRPTDGQPSPHFGFDLDADGHWMVVTEPESGRLHLYDTRNGKEPIRIATFGGRGEGLLKYQRPSAVDVDMASRSVLVCDTGRRILEEVRIRIDPAAAIGQHLGVAQAVRRLDLERMQRTQPEGSILKGLMWPISPIGVLRDGQRTYVLDAANRTVIEFDAAWSPTRRLRSSKLGDPRAMAMGPDGVLWVTDAHAGQVVGFSTTDSEFGETTRVIGADRLDQPHGVVLLEDGTLFVADTGSDAVVRFDAEGNEVARVGTSGLGRDQFKKPRALSLDAEGRLIVNDHANHRGFLLTQDLAYVHAFGSRPYALPARDPQRYPPEGYGE